MKTSSSARMRRRRLSVCGALWVGLLLGMVTARAAPVTADTAVRKTGYLTVADGTRLKWTVLLPSDSGQFPVLMQYEGYLAGSYPSRVNGPFADEMLQAGYAILGVSLRGTACSGGVWDPFQPIYGEDGAEAVDWAAAEPWSSGKVGMFSYSFAGIMQLFVAIHQPAGLSAIAPGMPISDTYRDIGFPGGILNNGFPPLWDVALHESWASAASQAQKENDVECLTNIAAHQVANEPYSLLVQGLQHLYLDDWHRTRSSVDDLSKINVPILGVTVDQDEEVGPRGALSFQRTDPTLTWTVSTNGYHDLYQDSPQLHTLLRQFFDHYLRAIDNGWERTPHMQLWHETLEATKNPTWISSSNKRPFPVTPKSWSLGADGVLTTTAGKTGAVSYIYPAASPTYASERLVTGSQSGAGWTASPVIAGSYAAYTTPTLTQDLFLTGPASLDAWIISTATDADIQATVTEVRPDGQEIYVERGWLRLSHRALDTTQSTALNPVHVDTQAAQVDMPAGMPQLARIAVQPFTHVFRTGSSLRIWLDTPSVTGLWDFLLSPIPSTLTVLNDSDHPSTFIVGVIPGATAEGHLLPACGVLSSMSCRPNPLPVTTGDESGSGGSGSGGNPDTGSSAAGSGAVAGDSSGDKTASDGSGRFGGALSWINVIFAIGILARKSRQRLLRMVCVRGDSIGRT